MQLRLGRSIQGIVLHIEDTEESFSAHGGAEYNILGLKMSYHDRKVRMEYNPETFVMGDQIVIDDVLHIFMQAPAKARNEPQIRSTRHRRFTRQRPQPVW